MLYRRGISQGSFSQGLSLLREAAGAILITPGRRIGQRRDVTRAPTQGPEWRGGASRPKETPTISGAKAISPRGLGT